MTQGSARVATAVALGLFATGGVARAFECQPLVASEYAHMQQQSEISRDAGERAKAIRLKAQEQKRRLTPAERELAIQEIRLACTASSLAYLSMRMLKWSLESPDCAKHPERGDAPKLSDPIKTTGEHLHTICNAQDWLR